MTALMSTVKSSDGWSGKGHTESGEWYPKTWRDGGNHHQTHRFDLTFNETENKVPLLSYTAAGVDSNILRAKFSAGLLQTLYHSAKSVAPRDVASVPAGLARYVLARRQLASIDRSFG